MKMRSAIPALPVSNMEEGVRFYRDILAVIISHQDTGYAVISRDQIQVHLWGATDESWRTRKDGDPIESGAETFLAGTHSCRIEVEGKLMKSIRSWSRSRSCIRMRRSRVSPGAHANLACSIHTVIS